jgi:hypothetical protein
MKRKAGNECKKDMKTGNERGKRIIVNIFVSYPCLLILRILSQLKYIIKVYLYSSEGTDCYRFYVIMH